MIDTEFIREEKVPMTKEEIRYIILGNLGISKAENFLDIGSGTGSITIEAMTLNKNLKVTAIEKNKDAIKTLNKNLDKFTINKERIDIIEETAPIRLDNSYDSIFIGGSGGKLVEILAWVQSISAKDTTIVMTFISLENFIKAREYLEKQEDIKITKILQIHISKLENLSTIKYFKPGNPVFLIKAKGV